MGQNLTTIIIKMSQNQRLIPLNLSRGNTVFCVVSFNTSPSNLSADVSLDLTSLFLAQSLIKSHSFHQTDRFSISRNQNTVLLPNNRVQVQTNMHILLIIFLHGLTATTTLAVQTESTNRLTTTVSPRCQSQCGNLIVPYPFGIGIGTNCSLNPSFDIICNTSFSPPRPFLPRGGFQVYNISDSKLRVRNSISRRCYNSSGYMTENKTVWADLAESPYTFSDTNKFTVTGCNDYAVINGDDSRRSVATGCLSLCFNPKDVVSGNCSGIGCCQRLFPRVGITIIPARVNGGSSVRSFNPCSYAFLGEEDKFTFQGLSDFNDTEFVTRTLANVPVVLDWAIGNLSCADARKTNALACHANSVCVNSDRGVNGEYRQMQFRLRG